jgi:hypothetical protein
MDLYGTSLQQHTGKAAGFAIGSALLSFLSTFSGHVILGLLLGILAVPLGLAGAVIAASPRVSGGIISVVGIFVGLLGIVFAIFGMLGKLL